ncbi:MIP/aquaporin family protein [Streptomyces coffeae]|uniref:Aquaporin n=1 Tax=Streptomyces coffeae TaxID=621382 RepID=A0ABS1NED5_9ACTN|nr:aquaporin [Streptomyces coffeae]MBL1098416.1 aquaporin [Streptomyces coffeae]
MFSGTRGHSHRKIASPSSDNPRPTARYHWAAAAVEFALTGVLLFVVVTAVRWVMASPLGAHLPDLRLQLTVVAGIVALALWLALRSLWGRYSGGHLNPAVTLALWVTGAFPGRDVLPYAVAQLAGSLVGTGLARLVWGTVVSGPMAYAAVGPAPGWTAPALFAAEAGATALIMGLALLLLALPQGTRWIPMALPLAVAAAIVALGPSTGGSANPARQLGPALWAGRTDSLWIYLLAPPTGASLVALIARWSTLNKRARSASPPTH